MKIIIFCLFFISFFHLYAQNTDDEDDGDRFEFSGRSTSIAFAEGRERTVLEGEAVINSKDVYISAEKIEIYGDNFRYAICNGGVRLEDLERGYRLQTSELFFDREQEVTRAEGATVMEDIENELVIKGGLLENNNQNNIATIQIGVRILGEDITARSEFARFDRNKNSLELSGLPLVYWKGDEYRAARIVVNLDDDTIFLHGGVSGEITTEKEDETDNEPGEENENAESAEPTESVQENDAADNQDSNSERSIP